MAEENQKIDGPTNTNKAHEAHNLQQLTCGLSPAQVKVCQLVAEYRTPKEIIRSCAQAIAGGQITESWIRHMVSPATRPECYRRVVDLMRQIMRDPAEMALYDPAVIARERHATIEHARGKGDHSAALEGLRDAERVAGLLREDARQPATAVQVNVNLDALARMGDVTETAPGVPAPVIDAEAEEVQHE